MGWFARMLTAMCSIHLPSAWAPVVCRQRGSGSLAAACRTPAQSSSLVGRSSASHTTPCNDRAVRFTKWITAPQPQPNSQKSLPAVKLARKVLTTSGDRVGRDSTVV